MSNKFCSFAVANDAYHLFLICMSVVPGGPIDFPMDRWSIEIHRNRHDFAIPLFAEESARTKREREGETRTSVGFAFTISLPLERQTTKAESLKKRERERVIEGKREEGSRLLCIQNEDSAAGIFRVSNPRRA